MRRALYLIVMLLMVNVVAAINCYQETATQAEECGALGTGSYSWIGTGTTPFAYDGDWWTVAAAPGQDSTLFIKYGKPENATINSTWKVKYSVNPIKEEYREIPKECFDRNPIEFRLRQRATGDSSMFYCMYADSSWRYMFSGSYQVYEEAMLWHLSYPPDPEPVIINETNQTNEINTTPPYIPPTHFPQLNITRDENCTHRVLTYCHVVSNAINQPPENDIVYTTADKCPETAILIPTTSAVPDIWKYYAEVIYVWYYLPDCEWSDDMEPIYEHRENITLNFDFEEIKEKLEEPPQSLINSNLNRLREWVINVFCSLWGWKVWAVCQ